MPDIPRLRLVLKRAFPFLEWIKDYRGKSFRGDLIAGLTVSAVLIPQAMGYAMLAGLPPVYGLYAGVLAPAIGGMWGSLRQLATGPIAIASLLVLTALSPIAEPGTQPYLDLAFQLALLVGLIYLVFGVFRLGAVMAFVSYSAVRGFTAAASLIIISTQVPRMLGIEVENHEYILPMLVGIVEQIPSINLPTAIVGVVSFFIIFGLKKIRPWIPAALVTLIIATIAVYFGLREMGIAVIGETPGGLPRPHLPAFDLAVTNTLLGPAFVIALVSFAETYAVGKAISAKTEQMVDVDQEFIGQGLANLLGSFFQSYPVSGSFSRTAINHATGAVTGISGVIASLIVVLVLLFLTPLFAFVPRAALAALVISAVLTLFKPMEVFTLWRVNRHDGIVAISVFFLALVAKPDFALLIGVVISLVLFLWKTMHPRIVRITKDPTSEKFINADSTGKQTCPQIMHLQCDNVIYFANADYTVAQIIERVDGTDSPLKFVLINLSAVGFIDITGIEALRNLERELVRRGIRLALFEVHAPVRTAFDDAGFMAGSGDDESAGSGSILIHNKGDAITRTFSGIDHDYCCDVCPHVLFRECATVKKPQ
jgi:SulP family sulfate permease